MAKSKRGQGEWSFSQRKDKLWTARRQFGKKENGKPNIVAFYGKSITEVRRKAKEYEEKLATNQPTIACKTILKDYVRNWLNTVKLHSVKDTTFDGLELSLKRIEAHPIANVQLCNLTTKLCQEFINDLTASEKKYAMATIAKTYNTLNAALKYAVGNDDIHKNPMALVKLPSPDKVQTKEKEIEFFTPDELKQLKAECLRTFSNGTSIYGYGDVIILLAYTGMRIGECLGLRWSDYDADNRKLKIDNTVAVVKNRSDGKKRTKITDTTTKTEKSTRIIPLSQTAVDTLERIRSCSKFTAPNDYIVCTRLGKVGNARNVRRCLEHILARCKFKGDDVDGRSLHSLRHTFVSMLLSKGVNIKIISDLVGHKKVSTTYNIYAHLIQEQISDSVNLLDEE